MPPYLSPIHMFKSSLPPHCEPENEFLHGLSVTFSTCIPTNLAFLSIALGTCSIITWLFAQVPQIYKNHQLKSTSGLSIFFLAEWLLGDLSNLLGSLFTHQALWQVIIACYYVIVDCALVGQYIWYEALKHGRPQRPIWGSTDNLTGGGAGTLDGMQEVWDEDTAGNSSSSSDKKVMSGESQPRDKPERPDLKHPFRIPNFARSPSGNRDSSSSPTLRTASNRTIERVGKSSPMLSPKTILYVSLVLAVLSNTSTATPVSPFAPVPYRALHLSARSSDAQSDPIALEIAGTVLSWLSTFLYLGSRVPQLYKNHVRKSTAGLSPTLFAAAFFGNLFYSTSMLTNPCVWNSFGPWGGGGWVGPEGNVQSDWVFRASPFFLGAAGVLIMDAAVGVQFWYFGESDSNRGRSSARDDEVLIVVNDTGYGRKLHRRWRRASGWMRGWIPSVSVAGTPNVSRAATPDQTPRGTTSQSPRRPSLSRGVVIGGRDALDEARALLGSSPGIYGSTPPRSYGGTSPR
jgi:uncharacterized protein with PQ loop repeat